MWRGVRKRLVDALRFLLGPVWEGYLKTLLCDLNAKNYGAHIGVSCLVGELL